jgi:hypothetical protein
MLRERGAVGATKQLLADPRHTSYGFEKLWEMGELETSVEFAVCLPSAGKRYDGVVAGIAERCNGREYVSVKEPAGDFVIGYPRVPCPSNIAPLLPVSDRRGRDP